MRAIVELPGDGTRKVIDVPKLEDESTIDQLARSIAESIRSTMPSLNSAGHVLASVQIVSSHGNIHISCKA